MAQTISLIATYLSVARSIVCLDCRLSHFCTSLKPFDGFKCNLAGELVGFSDTLW